MTDDPVLSHAELEARMVEDLDRRLLTTATDPITAVRDWLRDWIARAETNPNPSIRALFVERGLSDKPTP